MSPEGRNRQKCRSLIKEGIRMESTQIMDMYNYPIRVGQFILVESFLGMSVVAYIIKEDKEFYAETSRGKKEKLSNLDHCNCTILYELATK